MAGLTPVIETYTDCISEGFLLGMGFIPSEDKDLTSHVLEAEGSDVLLRVSQVLAGLGVRAYLVGGFVRDVLLGRQTADIDIAVAADTLEIAPEIAAVLGGKHILLDKLNRVVRVLVPDEAAASTGGKWQIDLSPFKKSIEDDLAGRDFTIDAMAVDLSHIIYQPLAGIKGGMLEKRGEALPRPPQLIDPFNGWDDLCHGVVRVVSETAFLSDAARLLRAVRLAAELGFKIDGRTEALIQQYCHLIAGVAGERIREELLRLLDLPRTGQILRHLDGLGLLTAVIPEMAETKGVKQPKEHVWDVFNHSIETASAVDFLLRQGTCEYAGDEVLAVVPWSPRLAEHFSLEVSHGSTRRLLLKLAALLHDIAKPQTREVEAGGRVRFLGHAHEGADIVYNILTRLRFSAREIRQVELMTRYHLRPGQMSRDVLPSRRAIYRYFRDTGDAGIDIIFLNLADYLAARGPSLDLAEWQRHGQTVQYVLTQRFEQESSVLPPKLVSGHDLIDEFGMKPGPKFGEVLEAVREAQAAGEVATRDEAVSYIRDYLLSKVA